MCCGRAPAEGASCRASHPRRVVCARSHHHHHHNRGAGARTPPTDPSIDVDARPGAAAGVAANGAAIVGGLTGMAARIAASLVAAASAEWGSPAHPARPPHTHSSRGDSMPGDARRACVDGILPSHAGCPMRWWWPVQPSVWALTRTRPYQGCGQHGHRRLSAVRRVHPRQARRGGCDRWRAPVGWKGASLRESAIRSHADALPATPRTVGASTATVASDPHPSRACSGGSGANSRRRRLGEGAATQLGVR